MAFLLFVYTPRLRKKNSDLSAKRGTEGDRAQSVSCITIVNQNSIIIKGITVKKTYRLSTLRTCAVTVRRGQESPEDLHCTIMVGTATVPAQSRQDCNTQLRSCFNNRDKIKTL